MNILKGGSWQRRKIGTAEFDDQHNFSLSPTGEASKTYALPDLQSVQWEPNGFTEKSTINTGKLNAVSSGAIDEGNFAAPAGPAPVPKACSIDNPDCEACQ